MDFFKYASVAEMFVNTDTWWVPFLVGGLCFAVVYVFQSVGLFIISGREGYKNRWMAFIPFVNTYYIGVCGQKNRVFRTVDTKILSLIAAVLEFLLVSGYVVYYVAQIELLNAGCIYEVAQEPGYGSFVREYVLKDVPPSLAWAGWCFEYLSRYILSFGELAYLVLQVLVLSAFFQTFAAKRYMLFTVTSVLFPVKGILIFIIRNNSGLNFRDFLRAEQERQYRMYQQYRQQNMDNNPYNRNPYSQNPYDSEYSHPADGGENRNSGNGGSSSDDPFSEFGGKGGSSGDPFEN